MSILKGEILTTTHIQSMTRVNEGYGVISGCDVTQQASPTMGITVDAGSILYGGVTTAVAGGNVTIDASTSLPRFDIIYLDSGGNAHVIKGTAAAVLPGNPPVTNFKMMNTPYPNPSIPTGVILARIYVAANATTILNASIDSVAMYATTPTKIGLGNVTNDAQVKASSVVTTIANPGLDTTVPTEKSVRTELESLKAIQRNYVWNSSFEYLLGTSILGWTTLGTATVSSYTSTAPRDAFHVPVSGNGYCLKVISAGAGNEGSSQTLKNLKASTTYTFRCLAMATSGDTAKAWTTGASSNLSVTTTSATWIAITGTFTTDGTPTNVVLKLGSDTSTDVVYFDQITVNEGIGVPASYFCDLEWDTPKQLQFGAGSGDLVAGTGIVPGSFKQSQGMYEIVGWELIESSATPLATATATIDVIKSDTYAPTAGNSICASAKPAIATVTNANSTTLTGWTTSINKGDWLAINVTANDLAQSLDLFLTIRRL